jgi:hypothetical protein
MGSRPGHRRADRPQGHRVQHRWVIERTMVWLFGYHRLSIRYDRKATHYCAFRTLAATLTCYKKTRHTHQVRQGLSRSW